MKHLLKGIMAIGIMPLVMSGCVTAPQQGNMAHPHGKRIFIPQERVIIERPIPPKVVPNSYQTWLASGDNLRRVREYEQFLERNNVGNIIPSFELMRTARDWQNVAAHNMPSQIVNYGITSWQPYVYLNTW